MGQALKLKGKRPEAVGERRKRFIVLLRVSSFPLAGVFIESRCYMNAPVKYHMQTLLGSLSPKFTEEALCCAQMPVTTLPQPLCPVQVHHSFSISLRTKRYTTALKTNYRKPCLMSPSDTDLINFCTIASFCTHF